MKKVLTVTMDGMQNGPIGATIPATPKGAQ